MTAASFLIRSLSFLSLELGGDAATLGSDATL